MKNRLKSIKMNAVLNVTRTLMSLVFPLITYPYASRILQLEKIGQYNYANSIVSYFMLIAGLGVATYAVREGAKIRDLKEKLTSFSSDVFSINVYATVAAYVLLTAGCLYVSKLQPYITLIMILSAQIVLTTLGVSWIYSIFEEYLMPTVLTIFMQIAAVICLLMFVHTPEDLYRYAVITVMAYTGPGIIQFFYARKYIPFRFLIKPDLSHLGKILIIFSTSIAATIYINSDITILGWVGGDVYAGLYGTAANIYKIVKQVLNATVAVVIPRFAFYLGTEKMEELQNLGNNMLNFMISVCLPAMVGLFCVSRPVAIVFAGESFANAGDSLRLLSIALVFAIFANYYANCVLLAFNREKTVMKATLVSAAVNLVLNIFIIPVLYDKGAALTTIIAECVMCMIVWRESRKVIQTKLDLHNLIAVIAGCAGIAAVCSATLHFIQNPVVILVVCIPVSAGLYAGIQVLMGNTVILEMFRNIGSRKQR